jgi:proteic killer suppression protein
MGLILDSSVLIAAEREGKNARQVLTAIHEHIGETEVNIAGYQLHPLVGDRKGEWAVSVSGNWRLVFRFDGENATDVDLVDYH